MKKTLLLLFFLISFKNFSKISIYKLTITNNYSQLAQVGTVTATAPGEGFTMKGTCSSENSDPKESGIVNNPGMGVKGQDLLIKKKVHFCNLKGQQKKLSAKTNDDNPLEPPSSIPYFKMTIKINNDFTRRLAFAFLSRAVDGDNYISTIDESLPNDASFWIDREDSISEGPNFDLSKKIALLVKASANARFKFHITEIVNFDDRKPIYLYDALDMSYHDITHDTYEAIVTPGRHTERFKICFKNEY